VKERAKEGTGEPESLKAAEAVEARVKEVSGGECSCHGQPAVQQFLNDCSRGRGSKMAEQVTAIMACRHLALESRLFAPSPPSFPRCCPCWFTP